MNEAVNSTRNFTPFVWTPPDTRTIDSITIALFVIIFIVGVPGNLLTIYVIARKGRVKTTTNVYILSLACADLVFVLCSPFYAVEILNTENHFGVVWCKVRDVLDVCTMLASVYTLTVMSIDRFFAVVFPIQSLGYRSDAVARMINILIWVSSFAVALPNMIYNVQVSFFFNDELIFFCVKRMSERAARAHVTTIFVLAFPIPFLVITFCYFSMIISLLSSKTGNMLTESDESKLSKRRVARMVFVIVTAFFVCWLPFWILKMLQFHDIVIKDKILNYVVEVFFIALTYVNSSINPLLYTFLSGNFRKNIKKVFKCCYKKVSPSQTVASTNSSSLTNQTNKDQRRHETGTF
ncbi:somatostatin receptor type 2-like [Glandiceps talaboti]